MLDKNLTFGGTSKLASFPYFNKSKVMVECKKVKKGTIKQRRRRYEVAH